MPIFEYRCGGCRSKFSLLVGVVAGSGDPRCPACGGVELQKLISRFSVARSEDDMLDPSLESPEHERLLETARLLEEARPGLQHAGLAWNSCQRAPM